MAAITYRSVKGAPLTNAEVDGNFSALNTDLVALQTTVAGLSVVPSQTGNSGKYLTTNGTTASWSTISATSVLPTQTGNSGKYLTTDGTTVSWATVSAGSSLPSLTGNSGKYLTTDGTTTSWSLIASPTSNVVQATVSTTVAKNTTYYVSVSGITLTLPASPTVGDTIGFVCRQTFTIAPNGANIEGTTGNMTIDTIPSSFNMVYLNATVGWMVC